jgi:hypothetical protein
VNIGSRWSLTRRLFGWWLTAMLSGRWARFQIAILLSGAQSDFDSALRDRVARDNERQEATRR